MDPYAEFLAGKAHRAAPIGFEPDVARMPADMKEFQSAVTGWACRRGRAALFEGTGLGKTLQELTWAQEVHHETRKPVLVLTPLAVAEQTVSEAEKFNIDGVAYASDQDEALTPIVVTNYDRMHLFDFSRFGGVVLDESSILKSADGKTRGAIMEACADVPYLLPASATPAPNDWTELGQHSELLGVMSAKEMLSMFFVHDGAARANGGGDGWRLKRHAEQEFWAWLASWAVMIRKPSDLGFDEPGYDLPPLNKHQITVKSGGPKPYEMFATDVTDMTDRIRERRDSLPERVGAATEIAMAGRGQPWVHWCNLNDEADAITRAIPGAVQISGSDAREDKKAKLLAFSRGEISDLVTKPKIAGWGMNWQHCHSFTCVGLNDSFESLYQLTRRFWRFGQTEAVDAYLIASEREGPVVANLNRKERDFEAMADAMALHMRDITRAAVRGGRVAVSDQRATRKLELPKWLTAA